MNAADVRDEVFGRLGAAIEAGADTWDMPWRSIDSTGWPANAATGNRYRTGAVWLFERRERVVRWRCVCGQHLPGMPYDTRQLGNPADEPNR